MRGAAVPAAHVAQKGLGAHAPSLHAFDRKMLGADACPPDVTFDEEQLRALLLARTCGSNHKKTRSRRLVLHSSFDTRLPGVAGGDSHGRPQRSTRGDKAREQFLVVKSEDFVLTTTPTAFDMRDVSFYGSARTYGTYSRGLHNTIFLFFFKIKLLQHLTSQAVRRIQGVVDVSQHPRNTVTARPVRLKAFAVL